MSELKSFLFEQILEALYNLNTKTEEGKDREGSHLEPNVVQKAILFWTFQRSARLERVGGVRGEGVESAEDYFAPITYQVFQRENINAPVFG